MSKDIITIDSRVSGYEGAPVRVLAVCIPSDGLIKVQKIGKYLEPITRNDKTVVVTDSPSHHSSWQLAFKEKEHLSEAIATYFDGVRGGRVKLESALSKYDPKQILELRKVDKSGAVHELNSAELNNGHIAVLLAVWASSKASMGYLLSQDSNPADEDDDDPMMPFSV